jgi:hypothetical protein
MRMRWLILFSVLCGLSCPLWSAVIIDVFGVDPIESQRIVKTYGQQVTTLVNALNKQMVNLKPGQEFPEKIQDVALQPDELVKKIKQTEGYLFVHLEEVFYPDKANHYVTIDIVTKNQPERLHWVHEEDYGPPVKKNPPDLLDTMTEYSELSEYIMQTEPLAAKDIPCPFYHCFMGFEHPQLKPYLSGFKRSATQDKALILDALNTETDPQRRASAVFLVGHFSDPQDIVNALLPHINDIDSRVRNNSLRVIATTLSKAKHITLDATPFLELLNSPYLTDRNKSLFVLHTLSQSEQSRPLFIRFGARLLALLALKQPNQHDPAYYILQQLSGKHWGEHNLLAWQNWLTSQQTLL